MPRYIDAEVFERRLEHPPYTIYNGEMFAEWFEECFKTQPTADVEPVRHGRWIVEKGSGEYAVCSECKGKSGTQWDGVEPIPLMTRYCPHCGARLIGGKE